MQRTARLSVIVCLLAASMVFAVDPPGPAVPLNSVTLDASKLRVHFIDVGPGLAALIETPQDRRHIVVDGGKWRGSYMLGYVLEFVSDSLYPRRSHVDFMILTHADIDHYNGMKDIFAVCQVDSFLYTGYESKELAKVKTWTNFLKEVDDADKCDAYVPLNEYVSVGEKETIDDGGTPGDPSDDIILHYLNVDSDSPERGPIFGREFNESERRNNASLVFKLIYKDVSFLFTGDINGRNEDQTDVSTDNEIDSEELELWVRHTLDPENYSLKATVLQAPHHGSNGSCSLPFIKAVDPEWVVIPAGHQYNHPAPARLRRFATAGIPGTHILRTDEGDSTPESPLVKDPRADDSYVFETDGTTITKIWRFKGWN
ncbi:MAG: hypothetical protein JSU86_01855 [Phycisphaerales bacterium]|nr:MAG: hypothetical protein JSU86_01855 [Phycisphaerales bacterium]